MREDQKSQSLTARQQQLFKPKDEERGFFIMLIMCVCFKDRIAEVHTVAI